MSRRLSPYSGGPRSNCCDICGRPFRGRGFIQKCGPCAQKIAKDVTNEFYKNIGHEMTEAIVTTGNEQLISAYEKQAIDDEKADGIPYGQSGACKISQIEQLLISDEPARKEDIEVTATKVTETKVHEASDNEPTT